MALYRKYRPATFAEVVGQEHVTEPLSTALTAGRINHAYLFSGPRGCGKTSSARILARSLNCVQGPTATPCGSCVLCVALAPNGPGSIDVIELDAASHGGVDDTRELRDRAFYAPAQSRYRVFIVDEAHMVTTAGFNALLKIVEEPPEHLIFIFATTEPEKVLPTIRSRTHHYPFRLLPPRTMRALIERICGHEDVVVDDAVYPLVIRAGGGSPRDTLSVLDQLLAGADGNRITYQRALGLLGATDVALIDDAVEALIAQDGAALFGAVESVIDAGHDPRRFAMDLLERFRDLIVVQAVPDAATRGLVDAPEDVMDRVRDQSARIGPATLTRYAEVVHAGLGEMRGATAPRLLLEVVCARLLLPSASDAESALLHRVERIETRLEMSIPARADSRRPDRSMPRPALVEPAVAPTPAPQQPAEPQRDDPPVPPAANQSSTPAEIPGEPDVTAVRAMWPAVREKVRQRSRTTEVMLAGATVLTLEGDTLVLAHASAPLAKRLTEQRNADVIADAVKDALGVAWRVRCEAGGPGSVEVDAAPVVSPQREDRAPAAASAPAPAVADVDAVRRAEEERMLTEAGQAEETVRRDPEEVALELLHNELGARRIDNG
ncbi:MAG: DNA polymerase III subunits gamma/tau [Mycobacteriaceae bacterium]|nr:DNA polymerase III subunits gamma/tau [Mycobacteriaceae bacterium]